MYNFVFNIPTKILFGQGQLNNLHKENLPGKRALIVTSNGQSTKKFGYLARVEEQLDKAGVGHILFDEIRPNPTNHNVMDGAKLAKSEGCDFVVALGGGSVMDCAKCIALMMTNDGDIWDYSLSAKGGKKAAEKDAAPIVCITTSAGTGSEVDIASVISNDEYEEKTGIFFPSMFPTLSVVDSDLMLSVPQRLTAYQGMDAFFHAAETVINKNVHPMAEMFALKTIEYVAKYLPIAYKNGNDAEARGYMALANTYAGFYMMCTSLHTMEHVMGSFHENMVHGAGLIMLSHNYFNFFAEKKASKEQFIKMAKAMGNQNALSAKDFITELDKLLKSIDCADLKMSEDGVTLDEIKKYPAKVKEVLGGDIEANPLPMSESDYLGIFEKSFK